jgi:hypothetical protein
LVNEKKIRKNSQIQTSVKKVVNGQISIGVSGRAFDMKYESGIKLRNPHNSNTATHSSAQKHRGHKHSASKSSFTNAAHQIMNCSIDGQFNNTELLRLRNDSKLNQSTTLDAPADFSQLANIAPS